MKYNLSTFFFFILSFFARAQNDTSAIPMSNGEKIVTVRKELINAFITEDYVSTGLWMDSLRTLENIEYIGLVWDERWLLYYWTESYGNLFEEVANFSETERTINDFKNQPPQDSLFEWLDYSLHERRFDMFQRIQKAFLNEEEKAFTTLLLEYLLRLEHDEAEWAARLEAFEKRYPDSRFRTYISYIKPKIKKKPANPVGFGLDFLLTQGNWRDQLERTLRPAFGVDFGLYIWQKRWNYILRMAITGQKLGRDIENDQNDIWPKGESSNYFTPSFDLGYDVISTPKFRCTPSVGAGLSILKPSTTEDDDGNTISEYPGFSFTSGQLNTAINLDVKLHDISEADVFERPGSGYGAIRVRFGYRWMNLGKRNPLLDGNMFFFAVGYSMMLR
ncbi:MAG: hypothetical protein IT262_13680 [Saprospiraceae bacterium]|nr:hypothetical protein [Saprospiraceae bacterium]